ncbi:hypothetical protein NA56DRAFT_645570 [Hyaloscypha hepaticicola]|uniref:Uncharacterized protein n=1 Tax=Hyaloscypha hepaticicola TaxID=2082293 RepID=A0A2J6Q677_9HELO|nr:hypothetical protein NA56DRAFT_645570 [Hyaloscypha hepaticicola]
MGLQQVPEMDYRSRLKDFLALEEKRNGLMEEILQKLDTVTAQLETVTNESAREVSVLKADLEDQKKARRGWQDEAAAQRERLASMVCHSQALYGCGSSLGRNRHGLCLC